MIRRVWHDHEEGFFLLSVPHGLWAIHRAHEDGRDLVSVLLGVTGRVFSEVPAGNHSAIWWMLWF